MVELPPCANRTIGDSALGCSIMADGGLRRVQSVQRRKSRALPILLWKSREGSASLAREKVTLADEPVHRDRIVTARRIDPFAVAIEHKTALLLETMELVHHQPGIVRSSAGLWARRDHKLFVSTEGSRLEFDLLALSGDFDATAVHDGRFASRSFNTPHLRMGYELIEDAISWPRPHASPLKLSRK